MSSSTVDDLIAANIEARKLVRELHEAIQDGARQKRELMALRKEIESTAAEVALTALRPFLEEMSESIEQQTRIVVNATDKIINMMGEKAAELAALKTPEEFIRLIIRSLSEVINASIEAKACAEAHRLTRRKRR